MSLVTIHIEANSADNARQEMLALLGNGMHEVAPLSTHAPESEKSGKKEKVKAAVSNDVAPPKGEPAKEPPTHPYKPVGDLILKTVAAKGRDAVVALLGTFGAALGSQLKPEQYADFTTQCQALLDKK